MERHSVSYCVNYFRIIYYLCVIISGSGKTMLMDMFYTSVKTPKKQRVHFNAFMLDVHQSKLFIVNYVIFDMN